MGVLAGLAVAGVAAGVMGGISASNAAAARNRANTQAWVEGELQKGVENGRQMFQAVHQEMKQAERNRAIKRSAYMFQDESRVALQKQTRFQNNALNRSTMQAKGAITANMAGGGTQRAMLMASTLNALDNTMQIEENEQQSIRNINRQTSSMMSRMTNNVFIPNQMGSAAKPEMEDTVMPLIGGIVSGAAQGLGGYTSGVSAGLGPA